MGQPPIVYGSGDDVAAQNRRQLQDAGVFCAHLMGGPGCGKTSLISAAVKRLGVSAGIAVITADPFMDSGANRLKRSCRHVLHIPLDGNSSLTPTHIAVALEGLNLPEIKILLIEDGDACTAPFGNDLGEAAKVAVFSLAAGDHRARECPEAVRDARLIILNKMDMLSIMPFDVESFDNDAKSLNPSAELFKLSTLTGEGMDQWLYWLSSRARS